MARLYQAHQVDSRWRAWVEARLPWYHEHTERWRGVRSAVIDRQSAVVLKQAERVMDDYRSADRASGHER
jgi:hypothetical protein